jgi:stage V sporulation protein AD
MNFKFNNVYINDTSVVVGSLEGKGPLGSYFDSIDECKDSSFENSEIDILKKSIDILLEKNGLNVNDIDLVIGGELSNQLTTSSYSLRSYLISYIGVYSACSTIILSIGLASLILQNEQVKRVMAFTSSHNQSAERQFRNPVEYGGNKEHTQTFTSTVGASAILSNNGTVVMVKSFTVGKVIDIGFSDSTDFGRAMAPAAIETLLSHFKTNNLTPDYYDLIITGDLSYFGSKIVKQALEEEYGTITNYNDSGLMLYDIAEQDVLAGGSGPGTVAAVTLGYIYKCILNGKFKKVLICGTGALMNPTMMNQKNSLPCIAHTISLESAI